jgi:hypothetical protein
VQDLSTAQGVGVCGLPAEFVVECTLTGESFVNPGDGLRVTLDGVTNPADTDPRTISVSTTSDAAPVTSAPYDVVAGHALAAPAVSVASDALSATTQYVVTTAVSSTGALAQSANSRIRVTFPDGTTFASYTGGSVRDLTTALDIGTCGLPAVQTIECTLLAGAAIGAGDGVRLTFPDVTNPPTRGTYTLTAATTSDTPAVPSGPFTIGDFTAPQTTIDSGPPALGNDATPTFTFSADESGSTFECRADAAAFASCTSPVTADTLADGAHTFSVRAIDAAGNTDASEAVAGFTVDTQRPSPPTIAAPADGPVLAAAAVHVSGTA